MHLKEKRVSLKQQNLDVANDSLVKLNAMNLKKLRTMKSYTLQILSGLSGLSTSYISRLEAGARRMNAQTLNRLARSLGCSPASFFETKNSALNLSVDEHGYTKNVPVYRVIPAGVQVGANPCSIIFLTDPIDHAFSLPQFVANENIFAIYAIDNLYAPRFKEGDLLYFDKSNVDAGDFVCLVDNDNCLFLGNLVSKNSESVILRVANKDGQFDDVAFQGDRVKQVAKLLTIILR